MFHIAKNSQVVQGLYVLGKS